MRYALAASHSTGCKKTHYLLLAAILCGGLFSASSTNAQLETAIDLLVAQEPELAAAFAAGVDPSDLHLSSGQSLADYLAAAAGSSGLVYSTLFPCRVLGTQLSTDGKMAADESRSFLVRGETDLTPQGGPVTGCGVPATAEAVMVSFVVFRPDGRGSLWARAAGQGSYEVLVNYRAGDARNNSTIQRLCKGTCVADFDLLTASAGAHVVARVTGYFLPLAEAVHTHDGSEIVSGEVDESVIDPDLARDTELLAHTTDMNNPHSVIDTNAATLCGTGEYLDGDGTCAPKLGLNDLTSCSGGDVPTYSGGTWVCRPHLVVVTAPFVDSGASISCPRGTRPLHIGVGCYPIPICHIQGQVSFSSSGGQVECFGADWGPAPLEYCFVLCD